MTDKETACCQAACWEIPVIVFHHVRPGLSYYTNTPPECFARQLDWLAATYGFWTVEEAFSAFRCGRNPAGHVVLTFDDGYDDNFDVARPLLARRGIRATFFVLADFVGRDNTWNPRCGYRARHMGWDQLRALQDEGHEIGSHGLGHRPLDELDGPALARELRRSQDILQEHLGRAIPFMAYPHGRFSSRVARLASRHYDAAFSTVKSRETCWVRAPHALRRIYLPASATRTAALSIVQGETTL